MLTECVSIVFFLRGTIPYFHIKDAESLKKILTQEKGQHQVLCIIIQRLIKIRNTAVFFFLIIQYL